MKKFITLLLIAASLFVSCDNTDTDNVSSLLEKPTVALNGPSSVFVPLNGTYNELGMTSTDKTGKSLEVLPYYSGKYRVAQSINTALAGEYLVTYWTQKQPSLTRKVFVYKNGDLTTSIEGIYIAAVTRTAIATTPPFAPIPGLTPKPYTNLKYVHVWKNANGTYQISDAYGGFFEIGGSKGVAQSLVNGQFTGAAGVFTPAKTKLSNSTLGGSAYINNDPDLLTTTSAPLTIDAVNKTIKFTTTWKENAATKWKFDVTLTQYQPQ
ncbi:DUF5011 domain-containing protein [Flavobacterium gilvum]|uniref:Lipoprotein n=1 Tax=Flavobacterium gilvum TaxID=1492737 RepID=A0AAC9I1S1_9FLAO|nr:DUF5011 domain-containing protein [Flavobacterium gilvum]AOW08210.1 hypothetical protein EM308_01050 [Flavobacterium gilvum]KFC59295.1 hypothetical protein FEM08_18990 [Flavobacterium gilvum]